MHQVDITNARQAINECKLGVSLLGDALRQANTFERDRVYGLVTWCFWHLDIILDAFAYAEGLDFKPSNKKPGAVPHLRAFPLACNDNNRSSQRQQDA